MGFGERVRSCALGGLIEGDAVAQIGRVQYGVRSRYSQRRGKDYGTMYEESRVNRKVKQLSARTRRKMTKTQWKSKHPESPTQPKMRPVQLVSAAQWKKQGGAVEQIVARFRTRTGTAPCGLKELAKRTGMIGSAGLSGPTRSGNINETEA